MNATFKVVTPTRSLIEGGYAKAIAEAFDHRPAMYDRKYAVAKAPRGAGDWEVAQLLGEHQAQAAARREAALVDSMRSLFQRLTDPELAAVYDRVYGRP